MTFRFSKSYNEWFWMSLNKKIESLKTSSLLRQAYDNGKILQNRKWNTKLQIYWFFICFVKFWSIILQGDSCKIYYLTMKLDILSLNKFLTLFGLGWLCKFILIEKTLLVLRSFSFSLCLVVVRIPLFSISSCLVYAIYFWVVLEFLHILMGLNAIYTSLSNMHLILCFFFRFLIPF